VPAGLRFFCPVRPPTDSLTAPSVLLNTLQFLRNPAHLPSGLAIPIQYVYTLKAQFVSSFHKDHKAAEVNTLVHLYFLLLNHSLATDSKSGPIFTSTKCSKDCKPHSTKKNKCLVDTCSMQKRQLSSSTTIFLIVWSLDWRAFLLLASNYKKI
jgi:hypothetical protein